jgi:hypothetical protein
MEELEMGTSGWNTRKSITKKTNIHTYKETKKQSRRKIKEE